MFAWGPYTLLVALSKSYLASFKNIPFLSKLAIVDSAVGNTGSRLITLVYQNKIQTL